jgi:hypothetical protein
MFSMGSRPYAGGRDDIVSGEFESRCGSLIIRGLGLNFSYLRYSKNSDQIRPARQRMLTIRKQQMDVLREAVLRLFHDRMAAHVQARFPTASIAAPDRVLDFIRESVELGKTFGIENQYDLRRFIEFRAEYGQHFHLLDWASKILNDRTLSGCGKMEQIDDYSLYVLR